MANVSFTSTTSTIVASGTINMNKRYGYTTVGNGASAIEVGCGCNCATRVAKLSIGTNASMGKTVSSSTTLSGIVLNAIPYAASSGAVTIKVSYSFSSGKPTATITATCTLPSTGLLSETNYGAYITYIPM